MKCELGKPVQWRDGEAELVGRIVLDGGQFVLGRDAQGRNGTVLVAHACTRELEFVPFGKLTPYPSEPIPTP